MTKALRKSEMTRSRLKNIYLENQNATNLSNYKYQRNFCTNPLQKTKFDYFRNLNVKDLNDNKNSGKKSSLSFQVKVQQVVTLFRKKGDLITDNQKLANLFITYFINITDTLQLKKLPLKSQSLSKIISLFENYDIMSKIKEIILFEKNFVSKRLIKSKRL